MAVVAFPARNKLAYPAGTKAGFDPSHVASRNMSPGHGLSAIAVPAGGGGSSARTLNLLKGRPSINNIGNITYGINVIGPGLTCPPAGSKCLADGGNAAVVDTTQTLAAIIYYQTQASSAVLIGSGDVFASAWYLFVSATGEVITYTSANVASGIILNSNEAYFVAASNDNSNVYFIVKSLNTGKVMTATAAAAGSLSFTSTGTYGILGDDFSNSVVFPVAAVSYTPAFLPLSQLRQWAEDPWAFWYPPQARSLVAAASATPTTILYSLMNVG